MAWFLGRKRQGDVLQTQTQLLTRQVPFCNYCPFLSLPALIIWGPCVTDSICLYPAGWSFSSKTLHAIVRSMCGQLTTFIHGEWTGLTLQSHSVTKDRFLIISSMICFNGKSLYEQQLQLRYTDPLQQMKVKLQANAPLYKNMKDLVQVVC